MSAERLRKAAALMRERVEEAPKETRTSGLTSGVWLNSAHHMTVTPAQLLAVADLLDDIANVWDAIPGEPCDEFDVGPALAVADTYLGDDR